MPITLRSRLRMPAMSRSEPLGLSEIAELDAVFGFEFVQRSGFGEVAAFAVRNRHAQHLALAQRAGERRMRGLDAAAAPRGR